MTITLVYLAGMTTGFLLCWVLGVMLSIKFDDNVDEEE